MNLFAYGTLLDEEIMARVSGCRPARLPAILPGHRRHALIGKAYPAVVRQEGCTVQGICYLNLPLRAWQALDLFEDEMYERVPVRIITDAGLTLSAETYLCRPEFRHLLAADDWSFADFLRSHKARFEAEYAGFQDH